MERNCTFASPATAFASRVLPVPGGPTSSTPLGMRAPMLVYALGSLRKSTISASSSFSSSQPATSAKGFLSFSSLPSFVRALLNLPMPPCIPPALFIITYHSAMAAIMMIRYGRKLAHHGISTPLP